MSKVVDLNKWKQKPKTDETLGELIEDLEFCSEEEEKAKAKAVFEEAERRNEENRQRMIKERLKANKGVLRSYRIKS